MEKITDGFLEGFFDELFKEFSDDDIRYYISQNQDLIEYTNFERHQGTYNSISLLLDRAKIVDPDVVLDYFNIKPILLLIKRIRPEWIDVLKEEDFKGIHWLKRNVDELKQWFKGWLSNNTEYYNYQNYDNVAGGINIDAK